MTPEEIKEHAIAYAQNCLSIHRVGYDKWLADKSAPKLYDGLTLEQWELVISEGLICVVSTLWGERIAKLKGINGFGFRENGWCCDTPFYSDYGHTAHCTIHPSQPQFCNGMRPDELTEEQMVLVRSKDGTFEVMPVCDIKWSTVVRYQVVAI